MKKSDVLDYLKKNQDARGIAHWEDHKQESGLQSYGVGLTKLRKYAKTIGKDAKLAKQLWNSQVYEMKIVSLLIDDPKLITIEQAEVQVENLQGGYLAHVFSSCDAQLAKTPFVVELADKWIKSKDPVRQRCGYGLLYEISKQKKKSAPDEQRKVFADFARQAFDLLDRKASSAEFISLQADYIPLMKTHAVLKAAALRLIDYITPSLMEAA